MSQNTFLLVALLGWIVYTPSWLLVLECLFKIAKQSISVKNIPLTVLRVNYSFSILYTFLVFLILTLVTYFYLIISSSGIACYNLTFHPSPKASHSYVVCYHLTFDSSFEVTHLYLTMFIYVVKRDFLQKLEFCAFFINLPVLSRASSREPEFMVVMSKGGPTKLWIQWYLGWLVFLCVRVRLTKSYKY